HWAYPEIPVEYEGTGEIVPEGIYDVVDKWDVKGRFANGVKFTFKGYNQDETFPDTDKTKFVGEEGWVAVSRAVLDAEPKSLLTSLIKPDEIHLHRGTSHYQDFLDAIRTRSDAEGSIDTAVQSDFISHLSDIAIRTGRKIKWDPEKEEIVGDEVASRMMGRAMRSPWTL
ncbi:MAG: Gfo/Idh/MocA family protein, partial [Planctomycetota bacterium]